MELNCDYSVYHKFVNEHLVDNFLRVPKNGETHDSTTSNAIEQQRRNKQYLFVSDLISFNHIYKSEVITDVLGYDRDTIGPGTILEYIHNDDLARHMITRSKLFSLAQDLYIKQEGEVLLSSNFRMKTKNGFYLNMLFQCYIFWEKPPIASALQIMVVSDITNLVNSVKQIHHYCGTDLSNFRYPDSTLMNLGITLSNREIEVVKLISEGFTSEEIATSLFLSSKTINTHRSNILKKLDKSNLIEVIHELRSIGVL